MTIPPVIVQHVSPGELPREGIRRKACLRPPPAVPSGMDKEQIILSVYLVKMGSLIAKAGMPRIADRQPVQAALQRAAEIAL